MEYQVEELQSVSGEANTVDRKMAASATTTSKSLSKDILTRIHADQKEHAAQMKCLTNVVAVLSTASLTPPAHGQRFKSKKPQRTYKN